MTISAYTGLPGHGKSYGVVENAIVPALQQKRKVVTNIPMNADVCIERFGMAPVQFDIQDVIDNPRWWADAELEGALVVLDEVWRLWPSGLKANAVRQQDKEFLAEHRHLVGEDGRATEIVLVTQDLSQVAQFARCLVENTFRVVKLTKVGLNTNFRVDVYFGPVTGHAPPISKRDREIHGRFKKEIYALYQSHTKSKTGGAGNEKRVDQRFNILKGGSVKVGIALFFLLSWAVYAGAKSLSASYGQSETTAPEPAKLQQAGSGEPDDQPDILQQQASTGETVPAQAKPKPKAFEFLSKAEIVLIVWNNGHFPNIEYRYKVVFKDHEATFSTAELATLDYELQPVNDCMVKIKGPDYEGFAMCPKTYEKPSWFKHAIDAPIDTDQT